MVGLPAIKKMLLHTAVMRGDCLGWGWRLYHDQCVLPSALVKAAWRVNTADMLRIADGGTVMTPMTFILSAPRQSLGHLLLQFDSWDVHFSPSPAPDSHSVL